MDIRTLTNQYCPIDFLMCYLPDIHNYSLNLSLFKSNPTLVSKEVFKINGGSSGHILLYWISNASNIIEYSILINSFIFGIITSRISFSLNKSVQTKTLFYLMIVPFAIFYSIGPTKEPLLFFALSVLFLPIFKTLNTLGLTLLFLCRPYLFFVSLYLNAVKNYVYDFLIILTLILSLPAIQNNVYDLKALATPAVKFSRVIDNLRFESYFFGFLGYISFGLKVLFEPLVYFFKSGLSGFTNILMDINLIILLVFIRNIFIFTTSRSYAPFLDQNKNLIRFLVLNTMIVFSYPIVQFRYLAIGLLVFNLKCLINNNEKAF